MPRLIWRSRSGKRSKFVTKKPTNCDIVQSCALKLRWSSRSADTRWLIRPTALWVTHSNVNGTTSCAHWPKHKRNESVAGRKIYLSSTRRPAAVSPP